MATTRSSSASPAAVSRSDTYDHAMATASAERDSLVLPAAVCSRARLVPGSLYAASPMLSAMLESASRSCAASARS